ncbi:hypothetical protein WME97_04195 [Sorangium sp. So ce367]|uniref:hypothetical protein n=1 Tax=Sorangium sp. So ce367 TaxID=3133305 RepID=UPI003F64390E
MDLVTVLISFVGTLAALAITKTIERAIVRRLDAADLSRDALVDVLSTLTSAHAVLKSLLAEEHPRSISDLPFTPSGWEISPLSLSLEKLLSVFDDEEIHRLVMLFFERNRLFVARSTEHAVSFFWLLDNPGVDWENPRSRERVETLKVTRARMRDYARDILSIGWELADRLTRYADEQPSYVRSMRGGVHSFIAKHYHLKPEDISLRASYYAVGGVPAVYDPEVPMYSLIWDDACAQCFAPLGACIDVVAEWPGEVSTTEHAFTIPALRVVTLPRALLVKKLSLRIAGRRERVHELRSTKLPPGTSTADVSQIVLASDDCLAVESFDKPMQTT